MVEQVPLVKLKISGREKPLVKLEPSVGQETRFGCEIEDFVALEKTSWDLNSLEFLFV